ncbi:AAA family ATPase [Prosthecochloris sp. N3]|uniref:AAA family ATPase n=1 Tax=Prosthecochloris ethylica TaxID=2743976 RepID=A0ABR9XPM3_9CHLB|nr:AAA family ATPase [Prosthecochloris ethylica]MBF0586285.1 AAA family ATPase [Prosthecochloris ethylica]MBF0635991.1 AAA family ATPase [Prosthecochloris ethylica]NUK47334.1 AAA family ATPase [Prosthecochloris ethylica]
MNIVTYSPRPWELSDAQLEPGQNQLTRLVGELPGMVRQITALKPDLVFLAGFEPVDPLYIRELEKLCLSLPQSSIITLHPHIEPELLLTLMRSGVREVIVDSSSETLQQVIERARLRAAGVSISHGKVLGFISSKGGDGSSCIAANLAFALAEKPDTRVLAIDASLPFGDLDMYLTGDIHSQDLADISGQAERLDKSLLDSMVQHISPALDLISSPATFDKIIEIEPECVSRLIHIAMNFYDYILVDIGSSLDQVGIWVLDDLDELCIVSTPSLPSLRRAGQLLKLVKESDKPASHIKIILNRADTSIPISISKIEKVIGRSISQRFASDTDAVQESLMIGQPLLQVAPKSKLSRNILDWAAHLTGSSHPKNSSLWQRLKIR